MKLYSYWRSTTSFRVRAALAMKGVAFDLIPVNLVDGEQRSAAYVEVNPGLGVPALVTDEGAVLTQSMAILDYIEEVYPEPALLPSDPIERAHVRGAAMGIATDIHPVNNLRILARLKAMGHTQDDTVDWMNHWMTEGFTSFSKLIRDDTPFCFGEAPGLADLCLVGQLLNAHRWGTDLSDFGRLTEIEANCLALAPFQSALPKNQPDAT